MLGKAIGVSWQHQGPLGKVERLILLMMASFLQYITIIFGIVLPLSVFGFTMILFILLGQVTVFNRVRGMVREIAQKERKG
jgi:ABC-type dipeptide/oligopeptide/nickel transport system permease subunit